MKTKTIPAGVEHKARNFELKADPSGGRKLHGLGAGFLNVDSTGDIIAPGAFAADLDEWIAGGFLGGLNHNWDQPIGRPASARETPKGLEFESAELIDTAHANDVLAMVRGGVVRKMSIGFSVAPGGQKWLEGEDECKEYWAANGYNPTDRDLERCRGGVRLLTRIKLYEVSPVTVPANDLASIQGLKAVPGARGGFDLHAETVAKAVEDFTARANQRHSARLKAGRVLSESNRTRLMALVASLQAAMDDIAELLAATEAPPKGDKAAEKAAPAALPEEPTPVVVPAIDEAELFAQYALTMYATNPDLS